MKVLLLTILCYALSATSGQIEYCYSHGKIYTIVKGRPVDSVDVMMKLKYIESIENVEERIKEKEKVFEIMKNQPCKF